jgi:hypothetical protein
MTDELGTKEPTGDKAASAPKNLETQPVELEKESATAIPGTPSLRTAIGKVADRPHRWTIGLSLLAAAISIVSATFSWLSLNETRENRRINEQTARAYLRPTSLVLDPLLMSESNWENKTLTGFVTITNTGRIAATEVSALLDTNPPRKETLFEIARFVELPPGSTNTVRVTLQMGHSKSLTNLSDSKELVFGLTIRYLDGLSPESRSDESTFCMSTAKSEAKGKASLYPCDVHFSGFAGNPSSSVNR